MHLQCSTRQTALFVFGLLISLIACLAPAAQAQITFFTPPTYAGGGAVFEADFNGDGKPDILTSDGILSFGNGDGTFKKGPSVLAGVVSLADFNGDGKADLLFSAGVSLGNGDGTFQPVISFAFGSPYAVAPADLNGDGKPDVVGLLYTYNALTTLVVALGNGDGTFAAAVPYSLGNYQGYPQQIIIGDFDGDHQVDVAVLTSVLTPGVLGQDIVFLGNGDGTFKPANISTGIGSLESGIAGDFNGDGKLDLAAMGLVGNNLNDYIQTIFLQTGNGDGTFQPPTTACILPGQDQDNFSAADLNANGKLDLIFVGSLIGACLGNGDGTFSAPTNYYETLTSLLNFGYTTQSFAAADFNLDGKLDIAARGEILLGNGDGTFRGQSAVVVPPTAPSVFPSPVPSSVVGRFVKNGPPAVATLSFPPTGVSSVSIVTSDGTGRLALAHNYVLPLIANEIATADVNGDGNLDLIITGADPSSSNWSFTVLLGNGDGSFQTPILYQQNATGGSAGIVLADFNNDGKMDIAVEAVANSVAVMLGKGDGTFGPPSYFLDGGASSIVTSDFNGDGNLDLAAAGNSGLAILLGKGDGTFQPAAFPYTSPIPNTLPFALLAADLNDDGKADIVAFTGQILVLLGNGDGTFKTLPQFGTFSAPVALADLNGDGKLDIISADQQPMGHEGYNSSNGIYLGNGDGTFATEIIIPYTSSCCVTIPFGIQPADMNGDGKPDLVMETGPAHGNSVFALLNSTPPGLGLTANPNTATVAPGSTATYTLTIGGVGSTGQVALTCSIASTPTGIGCSVSPTSVAVSATSTSAITVTVTTTSRIMVSLVVPPHFKFSPWLWAVALMGFVILPASPHKHFSKRKSLLSKYMRALPLLLIFLFPACGGGGTSSGGGSTGPQTNPNGTPAGTYTVTVTATPAGATSQSIPLTLTVQ